MDQDQNFYPDSDFADLSSDWQPEDALRNPEPQPDTFFTDAPDETSAAPQPKKQKKARSGKGLRIVAAILIAVLLCTTVALAIYSSVLSHRMDMLNKTMNNKLSVMEQQIASATAPQVVLPGNVPQEGLLTPGQVYAQNVRAVVGIASQSSAGSASGSGFIISSDGYVVTNHHVIEGAAKVRVTTADATEYTAQVIGSDATNDIALLKIEGEDLPHVTIGSSDALAVGEQVAAIGNPLGELTFTMTVGYVSAKDRMVTTDGTTISMMQTDAAINSGNSGGPLFNMQGQVVGITTAKYSGTSNSGASIEGIGFAIPMDDVLGIIEDLRDYGYVTGTYLGVMVRDVDENAQSYGLPAGAYIEEITPGFCAERAGLQAKDIIVNIGGYPINSITELSRVLRRFEPGDTTTITVWRSGKEVNLSITLDEKPQQEQQEAQQPQQQQPQQDPYGGMYPQFPDFFDYFFGNGWG